MYRCQKCQNVVSPRINRKVIVVKRPKVYYNGKVGHEIAAEIPVCPKCLNEHEQKQSA